MKAGHAGAAAIEEVLDMDERDQMLSLPRRHRPQPVEPRMGILALEQRPARFTRVEPGRTILDEPELTGAPA
jgi:hypothetical protein